MNRLQRMWNAWTANQIFRRGMRKVRRALADDSPVSDSERRRHDELVAAEMERAMRKRVAG